MSDVQTLIIDPLKQFYKDTQPVRPKFPFLFLFGFRALWSSFKPLTSEVRFDSNFVTHIILYLQELNKD